MIILTLTLLLMQLWEMFLKCNDRVTLALRDLLFLKPPFFLCGRSRTRCSLGLSGHAVCLSNASLRGEERLFHVSKSNLIPSSACPLLTLAATAAAAHQIVF